jgi:diguanylate cyclase (GGDEF)-like protein
VAEDGTPLTWEDDASRLLLRSGEPQRDAQFGLYVRDPERRWLRVTTTPRPGRDGASAGAVLTLQDVTVEHDREVALRRLAELDDLTGLPNRRRFLDTLERHLASTRREDRAGALLLIDLDRFKDLNDSFGHVAGDRLLVRVAHALRERLREDDVIARFGGDEFAVLLRRASVADVSRVAQALADRLAEEHAPAPHGGSRPVSASIGAVALGPLTGTAERALELADASMYEVKAAGRGAWRLHADTAPAPGVREQLAKRSRQLAVANALGARLAGMTDVRAIAEATVEELRRAFGYHLSAVIRLRPDDHVEAIAVRGAHFDALRMRGWSQPRETGLIGRCLAGRTPVLVNDVRLDRGYQQTSETADVRAELVVPLLVEGAVWGALNVEELEAGAFDHDDVILLSTLANQVAAAVRAAALIERLEALR